MTNQKVSWKWVGTLLITVLISICIYLCFSDSKPSLVQDQFSASTEDKFIYEVGSNKQDVSEDSTYYELRTRYDNIRITDIGTQHEIDSLRPIRAKQVVELWKEYKKLD